MSDAADLARDLRLVTGRLARRLRRAYVDAEDGLSFLELAVLHRLDRDGPSSPSVLATEESVTSAAIAAALTSLDGKGMITRQRSTEDGRRVVVTLTTEGRRTLDQREVASIERIKTVLEHDLSAAERARLAGAISLLEKVAEQL